MRALLFISVLILTACATTAAAPPAANTIYVAVLVLANGTQISEMDVMGASETKEACEKAVASVFEAAGPIPAGVHADAHCYPFQLPYAPTKAQRQAVVKPAPGEQSL